MTEKQVKEMINSVGIPTAYHHFAEGQSPNPPFLVYLYPRSHNFSADGKVYKKVNQLDIELYTDLKDPEIEKRIEVVLDVYGLFYEKTETYLDTENMYEILYETEVMIDE